MFLSSEEYNIALEMLEPVEEVAFGKGLKVLFSDDAKASASALREARKLKRKGDISGAKKKYQEAIKRYQNLKNTASKIEDDNAWDMILKLFVMPNVVLLGQAGYALRDNMTTRYTDMTKASTMRLIQDCIDIAKAEMNSL